MRHNENSVEYRPVVINKSTYDTLLKTEHPADALALYNFYYYTAIWQETNQARATDSYCMKGLKMGWRKFRRAKKELLKAGLIQAIKYVNKERQFQGHYIKVNYYAKKDTVTKAIQSTSTKMHLVENGTTNAYSANSLNAYKDNICMEDVKSSPSVGKLRYGDIDFKGYSKPTSKIIDKWYSTYVEKYNKYPAYTKVQWTRCINTIEDFVNEHSVEVDNIDDIVLGYFNTAFTKDVDYSLLHMANMKVLENRYYEYVYSSNKVLPRGDYNTLYPTWN